MIKINFDKFIYLVISILFIFIPLRELLSLYFGQFVKVIPDLLILTSTILFIRTKKYKVSYQKLDIFFALFLFVSFISTVFINNNGIIAFILQLRSISLFYVLYFIFRQVDFNFENFKKSVGVLEFMTFVLVGLSFLEKVFNKNYFFPNSWADSISYQDNFVRTYGLFNNPNTFAAFLLFGIILINYLDKEYGYKSTKFFNVIAISGMILTVSRSALIGLVMFVVLLLLAFKNLKDMKEMVLNIIGAVAIAVIVSVAFVSINTILFMGLGVFVLVLSVKYISLRQDSQRWVSTFILALVFASAINTLNYVYVDQSGQEGNGIVNRFLSSFDDTTLQNSAADGRIYSLKKGYTIYNDYVIFGTGFGSYGDAASLMISEDKIKNKYNLNDNFYADNEYVKILVEGGTIGVIFYAIFILSLVSDKLDNKYKLVTITIFMFLGLFYNVMEVQAITLPFFLILSISKKKVILQ